MANKEGMSEDPYDPTDDITRVERWIERGYLWYCNSTLEVSDKPPSNKEIANQEWCYLPHLLEIVKRHKELH